VGGRSVDFRQWPKWPLTLTVSRLMKIFRTKNNNPKITTNNNNYYNYNYNNNHATWKLSTKQTRPTNAAFVDAESQVPQKLNVRP
jgi:hypothetical protein